MENASTAWQDGITCAAIGIYWAKPCVEPMLNMCQYPARQLYRLPKGFDYHQAAAAALVYQTAWHSLVVRGNLQPNETVLIVGAGGGVNTASVQIAKYSGAQVVVVGSNADKLEKARAIGADILIDRSKDADWSKSVFLATDKRGVTWLWTTSAPPSCRACTV